MTLKDSKIEIKYSVIIPYYQQKNALVNCLRALSEQVYDGEMEILVIYHLGESDVNELKAQQPNVRWVANDQAPNPYISRNLGASQATGMHLCFIDSMCKPHPNWLYELDSYVVHNLGTEVIAGRIEVTPKSDSLRDQAHGMLYLNNKKNVERKYGVPAGHLMISKSLFEEHGGFETASPSGNDIVFTRKLIDAGHQIHYVDSAVVDYPGHSLDTLKNKMSKYAAGVAYHHKRTIKSSFFGFLPMRLSLFTANLKYRKIDHISPIKKVRLWFLIWGLKLHFNFGVMQGQ